MSIFEQITFDAATHTYALDGQPLTSVSRTLDRVTPKFDEQRIAERSAIKSGRTVGEVLAEWKAKRDASLAKGERVHAHIESVLTGRYDPTDMFLALNATTHEERAFDRFWKEIGSRLQLHRAEWIIGDAELGIAGRLDALFQSPDTGKHHLWDWKTGKCESSNRWETLLAPFDDLSNCEVARYSLQASLYRLILERNTDLELGESYLLHLTDSGEFKVHKVIDLRERLLAWLTS